MLLTTVPRSLNRSCIFFINSPIKWSTPVSTPKTFSPAAKAWTKKKKKNQYDEHTVGWETISISTLIISGVKHFVV